MDCLSKNRKNMFFCELFLLVLLVHGLQSKSSCSKYDFEEKVLEKMVRIEFETERMKESNFESITVMKNLKTSVDSSLKTMEEKLTETDTKLENKFAELEQRHSEKIAELERLAERVAIKTIAFKATVESSTDVSAGQTIIFPKVVFNEGDGYNPETGIFKATYGGTYIFTTLICPYVKKFFNYGIVVDGKPSSVVTLFASEDSSCTSADSVTVLRAGQQVWVKTLPNLSSGAGVSQDSHRWNTFSGVLIHN